jgi:hypothetical protein
MIGVSMGWLFYHQNMMILLTSINEPSNIDGMMMGSREGRK